MDWMQEWTHISKTFLEMPWWLLLLRVALAVICGGVIGIEREYKQRPAGFRTYIIVCLSAMLVMTTGEGLSIAAQAQDINSDPARLGAQVISGIGFLGAGTIIVTGRQQVKGLTTAASLWAVACLGIAAGGGYYAVSLTGMVFIFITLTIFEVLQNKLMGPVNHLHNYLLETGDISAALQAIHGHAQKQRAEIRDMLTERLPDDSYRIAFRVEIGGSSSKKRRQKLLESLAADPAITSIQLTEEQAEAAR